MKITGITIKNYLIFKELALAGDQLSPKLNLFVGRNATGKTSLVEAIKTAFEGTTDQTVIRTGADKSEIFIDLDNGQTVKWKMTRSGQIREVVLNKEGDKKSRPADYIASLLGTYPFSPIDFLNSKNRAKYLKDMVSFKVTRDMLIEAGVGEDVLKALNLTDDGFQVLKMAESIYYTRRTDANKVGSQKKAILEVEEKKVEGFDGTAYDARQVETLKSQMTEKEREISKAESLVEQNRKNQERIQRFEQDIKLYQVKLTEIPNDIAEREVTLHVDLEQIDSTIMELKKKLHELQAKRETVEEQCHEIHALVATKERIEGNIRQANETIAALTIENIPDIKTLKTERNDLDFQCSKALASQIKFNSWMTIQQTLKPEYEAADQKAKALTVILDKLRIDIPDKLMKDAKIPVEGLRLDGDNVFIGDKSLDHMSGRERVKIALTILRELNKDAELKAFCLDGAEALDPESLEAFIEAIQPDEFQYFMTMVQHCKDEDIPVGAMAMKDGMVAKRKQGKLI